MTTFIAFCVIVVAGNFINFKHQVKSHQDPVQEDSVLKEKKVNLPGYNHAEGKDKLE